MGTKAAFVTVGEKKTFDAKEKRERVLASSIKIKTGAKI